jgi:dTDP-glucose pyrophosphorylase
MSGLSSRFFKAGYDIPKYQLPLRKHSVFYHAVNSFVNYFDKEKFIFVVRDIYDTIEFVQKEAVKLKIRDFDIVVLEHETKGQAETVYLGLKNYQNDFPITIFNIDTVRYNYIKPDFINECDGYLEVFKGEGEHWSFVLADTDGSVTKTTEKERISDLCSDGLYYFKSKSRFQDIFFETTQNNDTVFDEYYIAPMYNKLIAKGFKIKYDLISTNEIDFCGTPEEYEFLSKKFNDSDFQ